MTTNLFVLLNEVYLILSAYQIRMMMRMAGVGMILNKKKVSDCI